MKKILFAALAAFGLGAAGSGEAADLSPVYKAPPAPPPVVYDWSGFYIGGFVGGAWGGNTTVRDLYGWTAGNPYVEPPVYWSHGLGSSFIGGGTIGLNFQRPGSPLVLGLEGEIGFLRLKGSGARPVLGDIRDFDLTASTRIGDWYAFVGGRLGYAQDRTLFYAKGGAAFLKAHYEVSDAMYGLYTSGNKTYSTWAVGGGIEHAFAPRWTAKIEYLYLGLNKSHTTCGLWDDATWCFDHKTDGIHTLKVGVNYKFEWGKGPVVARY